jgi:hypothetical protein
MDADSIFFDNDRTLFATMKYVGTDFEGDMQRMRANPKVREWWAMTDGMQVSFNFFNFLFIYPVIGADLICCTRRVRFLVLWVAQRVLGGGRC